ncbi:hypothetical protein D3C78_1648700 [compost metagenome]
MCHGLPFKTREMLNQFFAGKKGGVVVSNMPAKHAGNLFISLNSCDESAQPDIRNRLRILSDHGNELAFRALDR